MKHECKITVLETKCFADYQEKYLADPHSGPCPFFKKGDTFLLKRTPQQDDFYHLMNGRFCGEAWDAIIRYVYTALQGGAIMKGWTNDDRIMITCSSTPRKNRSTDSWRRCLTASGCVAWALSFRTTQQYGQCRG